MIVLSTVPPRYSGAPGYYQALKLGAERRAIQSGESGFCDQGTNQLEADSRHGGSCGLEHVLCVHVCCTRGHVLMCTQVVYVNWKWICQRRGEWAHKITMAIH